MNRTSTGLIIALLIIAIVAGWWFLNNGAGQPKQPTIPLENLPASKPVTVPNASPSDITPVSFDSFQENTYILGIEEAIEIPEDPYTNSGYLIHVLSSTNNKVNVEIVKLLDGAKETQELALKQEETGRFLSGHCPSFLITPAEITTEAVTLSINLVQCTL